MEVIRRVLFVNKRKDCRDGISGYKKYSVHLKVLIRKFPLHNWPIFECTRHVVINTSMKQEVREGFLGHLNSMRKRSFSCVWYNNITRNLAKIVGLFPDFGRVICAALGANESVLIDWVCFIFRHLRGSREAVIATKKSRPLQRGSE